LKVLEGIFVVFALKRKSQEDEYEMLDQCWVADAGGQQTSQLVEYYRIYVHQAQRCHG
jgi:hypothetical protein